MQLSVVLVRTKYSNNIGATARAMANMGAHQLILIEPQCEKNLEAYKSAACGQSILDHSQIFTNWQNYLELYPKSIKVGFTARSCKKRTSYFWKDLLQQNLNFENTHLVFGPEDHGL